MPIISQFYGIIISMYFNDNNQHNLPHIHVRYNEFKATYDFETNLLSGTYPDTNLFIPTEFAYIIN